MKRFANSEEPLSRNEIIEEYNKAVDNNYELREYAKNRDKIITGLNKIILAKDSIIEIQKSSRENLNTILENLDLIIKCKDRGIKWMWVCIACFSIADIISLSRIIFKY